MVAFSSLFMAAGLATIGASFSVTQVPNPHFPGHYGPLQMAKTYRKYGIPIPDRLHAAVERYQGVTRDHLGRRSKLIYGNVTAKPHQHGAEYLSPVHIGTPPKTLHLDFDTGSSDFWVFSTELSKAQITNQTLYDPSQSTTAKKLDGATWEIRYGDDSYCGGDVYLDKVRIGGVTVKSQAVETAQEVSAQFVENGLIDGLVGFGFGTINQVHPNRQNTFFDNIRPSLDSPVFTADLKHHQPGQYSFGYINESAYTGAIQYVDVDNAKGFWAVNVTGYSISSLSSSPANNTPYETGYIGAAIADTGTTLVLIDSSIVKQYYAQIDGAKFDNDQYAYTFPCKSSIPDFTFSMMASQAQQPTAQTGGGYGSDGTQKMKQSQNQNQTQDFVNVTIPAHYLNYGKIDKTSGYCYGGIQNSNIPYFAIFGDVALKTSFVVFENDEAKPGPRIGWASKKRD